jgi:hypothetical protein
MIRSLRKMRTGNGRWMAAKMPYQLWQRWQDAPKPEEHVLTAPNASS